MRWTYQALEEWYWRLPRYFLPLFAPWPFIPDSPPSDAGYDQQRFLMLIEELKLPLQLNLRSQRLSHPIPPFAPSPKLQGPQLRQVGTHSVLAGSPRIRILLFCNQATHFFVPCTQSPIFGPPPLRACIHRLTPPYATRIQHACCCACSGAYHCTGLCCPRRCLWSEHGRVFLQGALSS